MEAVGADTDTIHQIRTPPNCMTQRVEDVARLFIQALNSEDNATEWNILYEKLASIGHQQCSVIEEVTQLQHYLQRAYCYAQLHKCFDIIQSLQKYFPASMALLVKGTSFSNTIQQPITASKTSMARDHKKSSVASTEIFNPNIAMPMTFMGPKLNFSELENAAIDVANDVLTFHRNLDHVDLSWPFSAATNQHSIPQTPTHQRGPQLRPIFSGDIRKQAMEKSRDHFEHSDTVKGINKKKLPYFKTGFDVVNGFAQGRLKHHELIYLNYHSDSDCKHFNPYHLVVVLPYHVKPEYYIASRFGFFNIHPDGSTDPIPFSVWCRDAALFSTLQKIPFFKNYLIRKMLLHWRANARYKKFIRTCRKIEQAHLQYFPGVPQALLQIVKLIHELLSLRFYSFKPLKKYSLGDLETCLEISHSMAERYLKKFFKYCHRVVLGVVEGSHQQVSELEKTLRHQPTVFETTSTAMCTELSQRRRLEEDLQQARYRASRLGDFTMLVDQMLHHSLLQLAKENATHYLSLLLQRESHNHLDIDSSSDSDDSSISDSLNSNSRPSLTSVTADHQVPDALLLAKLDFNQQGILSVIPSLEQITGLLVNSLHKIIDIISTSSCPVESTNYKSSTTTLHSTTQLNTLKVHGKAMHLTISPLLRENFREQLQNDPQLAMDLSQVEQLTSVVCEDVNTFFSRQSWLNNVKAFIDTYSSSNVSDFLLPKKFKEIMHNLRGWLCDLRALPEYKICKYSLICINLKEIITSLTPLLEQISISLTTAALDEITAVGDKLHEEISHHNNTLVEKRYDLEGFAGYSWQIRTTEKFVVTAEPRIKFVQQMSEVLIALELCGDEEYCKQLLGFWQSFLATFQQAKEFVSCQTPLKAQGLEENIKSNEEEGMKLLSIINSGDYVNPLSDPNTIIAQAKEVQDRMYIIKSHLLGLNKWKEAITGQPHDMSLLSKLITAVDMRLELWKYRRVYDMVLNDWLKCPFKRLDIVHVAKKVSDWIRAAGELKQQLPIDDLVVDDWMTKLINFQTRIPLLECLTAKAIKTFHWQSIFSVLGQHYDPNIAFTLNDLLIYNIDQHASLLREICSSAVKENQLQQDLYAIQNAWDVALIETSRFNADKFLFAIRPNSKEGGGSRQKPREKMATFLIGGVIHGSHGFQQFYKLEECDQLSIMIEDHLIQLQNILSSPYVTPFRSQVENWLTSLTQLLELVNMLIKCQNLWLELLRQFQAIDAELHEACAVDQLQNVTKQFQEIINSITDDPRALSLLGKKRGQKGFREIQGDSLRTSLDSVYKSLENIVKEISNHLRTAWSVCPRLYYLNHIDILPLLTVNTNTNQLMHTISKVFPITSIKQLDIISHMDDKAEEGIQLVMVEGKHNEEIELVSPLPISKEPVYRWLTGLHRAMQFSIACNLRECITAMPKGIFSNLSPSHDDVLSWIKQYSVQCVLLALEVQWSSNVTAALTGDPVQLKCIMCNMEQCVQLIASTVRMGHNSARLYIALCNVIISLKNKLQYMQSLLLPTDSKSNWLWQCIVKYSVDQEKGQQDAIEVQKCSFSTISDDSGRTPVRGRVSMIPAYCKVEVAHANCWYDYEYSLPDRQMITTTECEQSLARLLIAFHHYYTGLLWGSTGCGKSELAQQIALLLGRHFYWHQFNGNVTVSVIEQLLRAAISTGSLLLLNGLSKLSTETLLTLADMFCSIRQQFSTACLNKNILLAASRDDESHKSNRTTPASGLPLARSSHSRSSGLSNEKNRIRKRINWYNVKDCAAFNSWIDCKLPGVSLQASSAFRCVVECRLGRQHLPALLIEQLRPVFAVAPNTTVLTKVLLLSEGFLHSVILAKKISYLWNMLKSQSSTIIQSACNNAVTIKKIVKQAAHLLRQQLNTCVVTQLNVEEESLVQSIWSHFDGKLEQADKDRLIDMLKINFSCPITAHVMSGNDERTLKEAIEMGLTDHHLQCLPLFVNKVLQLHQCVSTNKMIVLVGPSCSGKTTCYKTLIAAYHRLNMASQSYPKIHKVLVNMSAYSMQQLFGNNIPSDSHPEGMMFQLLQQLTSEAVDTKQCWLVCDGPLEFNKMEVLKELLCGDGLVSLNTGHKLIPSDSCRLLMETDKIDQLPPSIAVHCAIIHMDESVIPWRAIVDAWLEQAPTRHSLGSVCVEALSELLLQLIPKGAEFISQHSVYQQQGLAINFVRTLLTILSAQFQRIAPVMDRPSQFTASSSRCFSRESLSSSTYSMHNLESGSLQMTTSSQLGDRSSTSLKSSEVSDDRGDDDLTSVDLETESRRNLQRQMVHVFVYAYTWSIAAHTSLERLVQLNVFVREQMDQINLPLNLPDKADNMTDLNLNLKDFSFSLWSSREREPKTANYIPIPEVEKYAYLIELLVSTGSHVLLRGEEGCGKTSLIKYLVQPRLSLARVPITNNTTVDTLQDLLLQKVNQMVRFSLTKQVGSRKSNSSQYVIFLDDFHTGGANCQQLIYQVVSQSSVMDTHRSCYQHPLYNTSIIVSHTPQHELNDRLVNKMMIVPLYRITNKSLHKIIYKSIIFWLQQFPESAVNDVSLLANVLATASVGMHCNIVMRLTGSLSQLYHFFSIKDLLNVYHGLLQMTGTQGATAAVAKTHEQLAHRFQSRRLSGLKEKVSIQKQKSKKLQSSMLTKSMRSKQQLHVSTDHSTIRAILRLWCHEVTRVYADRLDNSHDKLWFLKLLETIAKYCFCGIHPQSSAPQVTGSRPGRGRVNNQSSSITELKQLGINTEVLTELLQPNDKVLALDQLTMRGEDLTGLMFAQLQLDSFYSELGDGQVMDYLNDAIAQYNINCCFECNSKPLDLILFRRAIEHVTRLCRVMRTGGGHALLVGSKGTGKKSLTRLAAYVKQCQLVEVPTDGTLNKASLKQLLRDVCITTGIEAKPVVLLVGDKISTEYMLTIAELMSEGIVQSLFTPSELLVMSSRRPGSGSRISKKKPRTADAAYQQLAECVLQYLHVVVCWNQFDCTILSTKLLVDGYAFRLVYRACSYIDLHEQWSKDSYLDVAVRWLKDQSAPSWDEWIESSSQLEAVGSLAVHMHLTSNKLAGPALSAAILSPTTFIECLSIAKTIALHMRKEEKCSVEKYQLALDKLWTLEKDIQQLEGNIAELQPLLDATQSESEAVMAEISSEKQCYMEASARCKDAESTINTETMNVKQLQTTVDKEFDKVAPIFERALVALSNVKSNDVLEMTGYINPPELLLPVAYCLCMLFDRPHSWADCKQLLLSKDFLKSLRFYDRDNLTKSKLKFLQKMIKQMPEKLDPSVVGKASQALVSICQWIQALVAYHAVNEMMQPHRHKLKLAEDTLMKAHEIFVAMKKDMLKIKDSLEQRVKNHKELVRKARSIEQDIEMVQRRLNKARKLQRALSEDKDYWHKMSTEANDNISTAAADALLMAGSACYLCSLNPDAVTELYDNWIDYCKGRVDLGEGLGSLVIDQQGVHERIKIRANCNHPEILTSSTERAFWTKENTFAGPAMKHHLLSAKIAANYYTNHLPLIFDPHNLFVEKVKFTEVSEEQIQLLAQGSVSQLTESSSQTILYVSAVSLLPEQLDNILRSGKVLVITCNNISELSDITVKKLTSSNTKVYLVVTGSTLSSVSADATKNLTNFSVINLSFSTSDLTAHLLMFIIQLERPEFIIRLRSVHNDISLHQQQIYECRDKVLSRVMSSSPHLLSECDQLMDLLVGVANVVEVARDRIKEAKKHLRELNYQKIGYNVLAEFAGMIMDVMSQVVTAYPHYYFSLQQLQSIINSVITKYGQKKLREGMTTQAHMMQMKQYLLSATYQHFSCQLFDCDHNLFPLLLSINTSRHKGKISGDEVNLMFLDTSKPNFTAVILGEVTSGRPYWMTSQAWAGVCYLHSHCPVFNDLPEMMSSNSSEWHEYFNSDQPSLITPTPATSHQFSVFQKLILWKIIKPSQVDQIIKCYILDVLGNEYCYSPAITTHQRLTYLDSSKLCIIMLSTSTSLATVDFSNLQQLGITAGTTVTQTSAHTTALLDNVVKELENRGEQWTVVTNVQLLADPELALRKLLEATMQCNDPTGMCRVFITLPIDVVSNELSPQLSSLLHTRMADYDEHISLVLSSCDPLKRLCSDHSSIVKEKSNSMLPVNWMMCDLKFASELLEEMNTSNYSQYQSDMIKWLLVDDDNEQSTTTDNSISSSRYYYTILPTINHTVTDAHHLVSTILTVIPAPLATETEDYDISVIKRHVIHSCCTQFNQLLQDVRSSLLQLSTLLTGCYDRIDDDQLQLLHCLLANRVPTYWHCPLGLPATVVDLTYYLEVLQRMAALMGEYLFQQPLAQRDHIDITYIPNIDGLLQEFKLCYCTDNNLQVEEISLLCELLQVLPTERDDKSLILTANELSLTTTTAQCSSSAPLTAIKVTVASSTDHLIKCPLILTYAQSNITRGTLAVNYSSSNKNISLMYRLQ